MDVSTLHQSAGRLNRALQPLASVSDKAIFLADEVKKLSSLIQIAEGAAYESKVIPLMGPALDTIQHTEDQINTKLQEIESIITFARSQLMTHMVSLCNASGRAVDGDVQTERDEIAIKLEEVGHDVEMAKFTAQTTPPLSDIDQHSNGLNNDTISGAKNSSSPLSWQQDGLSSVVRSIPDKNPQYCGDDGIYMQKLKSCIVNIHNDAAKSAKEKINEITEEETKVSEDNKLNGTRTHNTSPVQQYTPEYIAILGAESGLGKSALVREYCQQIRTSSETALIGWISATDEASLVLSYRELAMYIKSVHPTTFCVDRNIASLKKDALFLAVNFWIQRLTEPWILVIDNFDSEDILISQSFLPFVCSSSSPCTVIVTSRLLDLPFRWEILMEKKSADLLTKHGQKVASTIPSVLSASHQLLSQEVHALSSSKIGAVHMFPMSSEEAYELAVTILGEEIDAGSRWNRDGQKYVNSLCETLHFSPLAIKQAFSCIKVVQQHRLLLIEQNITNPSGSTSGSSKQSQSLISLTQVERFKEYANWLEDCRDVAEKAFDSTKAPFTTSLHQTSLVALNYVCEKSGHRAAAIDRALGLLSFLSPTAFDPRMLAAWFQPPNTPYLAKVQKKWRMPNVSANNTNMSGKSGGGYNLAEFEILVESVSPVLSSAGSRFSWRVFRTFDRIKDCIDAIKKIYSAELLSSDTGGTGLGIGMYSDFPSFSYRPLPTAAPEDMMEDAVSRRRTEIQTFFEKLVNCRLWGRVCTCESMRDLLGIMDSKAFSMSGSGSGNGGGTKNEYDRAYLYQPYTILDVFNNADAKKHPSGMKDDDHFAKLINPLFCLGFISVFKKRDIIFSALDTRSWMLCSINRDIQVVIKAWLKAEGRYSQVQNDVIKFLNASFRNAYHKYKRGSDVLAVKDSSDATSTPAKDIPHGLDSSPGALSCEQLILHVLSTLSSGISSCQEECFELTSLAYHYCSEEGLFAEALFCATLCVEIITQREGSVDSVEDGLWHSYLADMLCKLSRGDEANSMYEHSLLVLRKKCGHYHKQTFSVLARFGNNLFEQGKYKHSIKIMEEALKVCRHINSKANSSGIGGKLLESFSPNSSKSVSTITSLPVAGQIEQLVKVLLANAPDNRTVKRCLELKREQLSILRRAHGEYSLQVARCLNSMGELEQKDHSKKAREYFEDCLDVLVRCVGGDSRELIQPLHNLAMEEHSANNFKEAKKLYQRAIEIYHLKPPTTSTTTTTNNKLEHPESERAVIAAVHDSLGMLLGDAGDHESSMHHLEKGYQMYCVMYGSDNHEVAISLSNLARAWQRMGDSNMAKSLYSKSLKTLRTLGGRADEDIIARNLNALGEIYMGNKEYDEARQLFMECLSARVNLYGEKHADTVSVMKNLSVLAFTTGSYDEAHNICFTARAIQIELDGTDATVQAAALTGHLAEISRVLGKISDAEIFYKQSIALYRKIYGENHPSISLQINNMASMLFKCKRFQEAEALYVTSRNILTKFYGSDHASVATSINNVAKLNGALGRYEKAMSLHSEALGILLKLHGSENVIVANALIEMSELLLLKKDYNDAMDACSQALGIRTRLYGASANHTEIADSLYLMARIRVKTGEGMEAFKLFEDAIRMQATVEKTASGSTGTSSDEDFNSTDDIKKIVTSINDHKSSLKTANMIEDLCRLLSDKKELESKMLMFEKCLQIRRTILGEEDETVADSLAVLGDILFQRKMYDESIELQRVARAVKVKIRGENHPSSILSLNGIAKCLKSLGRLDEARSMFEQCVISTRRLYGDKNFSTSVALYELSRMLQLVEEYDTATTMAEQALEIRLEVESISNLEKERGGGGGGGLKATSCPAYGSNSPHYYLGQLYQLLGELSKALSDAEHAKLYFTKSRNMNRDMLDGLESVEGIDAMIGLAWALEALGNRDEASALYPDIKRCTARVYAMKDATYVREWNDMGKILRARGKYAEALIYFTKAKNIGRIVHGDAHHINTVDSLEGLAWLLEVQGKSSEATKLHSEVSVIRDALGDSDDEGGGLGSVLQSSAASLLGRLSLLLSEKTE